MTFRFRLATIERLRVAERDERRAKLADSLRAEAILDEQKQQTQTELRQLQAATRADIEPGTVNVDRVLDARRYQAVLELRMHDIDAQATRVRAETERRRQALVEADREVRVLEKLRDKQLAEFQHRELQQEIQQLDEIAAIRHARQAEQEP